jgi:hypothetical protein
MSYRKLGFSAAAACLAVAGLFLTAAGASATPTSPASVTTTSTPTGPAVTKQGMTITRFDPAVAKAHGYEIRTDSKGHQYSAKIGSAAPLDGSNPGQPSLGGNCGYSNIYYGAVGSKQAHVETGYDVILPVVASDWWVYVTDDAGTGKLTFDNSENGTPYWGITVDTHHSTTGFSWAEVSTSSYVVLDDGGYCTSAGPWDSTILY